MIVEINRRFVKDASKLPTDIQLLIKDLIFKIEKSENLNLFDIKKLKGYKSSYRIKLGAYRIGYYQLNETIYLERVLHRKDVYKYFP